MAFNRSFRLQNSGTLVLCNEIREDCATGGNVLRKLALGLSLTLALRSGAFGSALVSLIDIEKLLAE